MECGSAWRNLRQKSFKCFRLSRVVGMTRGLWRSIVRFCSVIGEFAVGFVPLSARSPADGPLGITVRPS